MPICEPFVVQYSNRDHVVPISPKLETDKRGTEYQLKRQEQLIEEQRKEEARRLFKAKPMPCGEPFIPSRSSKPLTQITDFTLNSEDRAVRRRTFDCKIQTKLQLQEEENVKLEEQRKIEEAENIKQIRKSMEFKARPMSISKPFIVTASTIPQTIPQSPILFTKRRKLGRDL